MSLSRFVVSLFGAGLMALGTSLVFGQATSTGSGQDYPNRPIRIVTATAGGGSDFIARTIAQGISGPLGQPLIIDNRSGPRTGETAAKAAPDGYTFIVQGASLWILPLLQKMPWDVVRDFTPVSLISRQVNVLVVHPALPVNSVKELIALAKSKPGALNYASTIPGGIQHLATELFKSMAGINMTWISYKGGQNAIGALLGGEVQVLALDVGLVAPHIKSGRMKALAVTSATPSTLAPNLPTMAAAGVPGYELVGSTGMWAPANTAGVIIARMNQEVVRVLNHPDVKERLLTSGEEIVASSPGQFAATIKSEIVKMSKVIKDAGIKLE